MTEDKAKRLVYAIARYFGFSTATVFSSGQIGMRGYGGLDVNAMFTAKRGDLPHMPIYADTKFFSWRAALKKIAGCRLAFSIVSGKDCATYISRPHKNRVFESANVEDLVIKLELEGCN